jgi:hypothetical protein
LALYLASEDADYVTGQSFTIDGGLEMNWGLNHLTARATISGVASRPLPFEQRFKRVFRFFHLEVVDDLGGRFGLTLRMQFDS